MKVLITGSASGVAKGVIRRLDEVYDLRLLDLHRSDDFLDHDWVIGSILDRKALDTALKQAEAVINFVIVRGDASELSFDVNVKGLYMLLEAIEYHGIKRFVQVSSTATVIGHWYEGKRITVDSPPTTRGRYSLCKMLQEQICEHVARNSEVRIVALRPWMPCDGLTEVDASGQKTLREYAPGLIDTSDFGEACRLAIEADLPRPFEVFHTVATQEARERFDADRTEALLGFRPKEDFQRLL